MMEEPGCTAGKVISPSPVRGPLASKRRSLEMRVSSSASPLILADKSCKSSMDCICATNWLERMGSPVSLASSAATFSG